MAIMEYLEETHPKPPLLPYDPRGRARVRGLSQICVSDAHPMSVPRVRKYLAHEFKLANDTMLEWVQHWQSAALRALETHLRATRRPAGTATATPSPSPTSASPARRSARASSRSICSRIRRVKRIVDACMQIDAFARAHPLKQPGAPASISH